MNPDIDPHDLYDRLHEEGILAESTDERLVLAEDLARNREQCRETVAELDDDAYAATVEEYTADRDEHPPGGLDEEILADAMAVHETSDSLDPTTSVHVASALRRTEAAPDEPIPPEFLSLSADEIDPFLGQHPASILYFWRKDCDPCEAVRDDLASLVEDGEIPPAVGLGAVYGPDFVTTLREEYDVSAAPTTLFCSRKGIESRFVGNPGRNALKQEIAILLDEVDEPLPSRSTTDR